MSARRPAPRLLAICALVAGMVNAESACADDGVVRRSVQFRVSEARQLAVFGGHGKDCITSTPPNAVQVVQAPRLGVLSQRQGVPYIAQHSISGTCLGERFFGTAVDYTARTPGTDTVALDLIFNNGVAHWVFSVTVLP